MAAATYDFIGNSAIEQGVTLSRVLTWKDPDAVLIDLTGYTARMQVRSKRASDAILLSLTTENSGIALGGAAGTITLTQTATQTAAYPWKRGVYDLELVSSAGTVTRLLQGSIEVPGEVTR